MDLACRKGFFNLALWFKKEEAHVHGIVKIDSVFVRIFYASIVE